MEPFRIPSNWRIELLSHREEKNLCRWLFDAELQKGDRMVRFEYSDGPLASGVGYALLRNGFVIATDTILQS